jgi:hypothetical protein
LGSIYGNCGWITEQLARLRILHEFAVGTQSRAEPILEAVETKLLMCFYRHLSNFVVWTYVSEHRDYFLIALYYYGPISFVEAVISKPQGVVAR